MGSLLHNIDVRLNALHPGDTVAAGCVVEVLHLRGHKVTSFCIDKGKNSQFNSLSAFQNHMFLPTDSPFSAGKLPICVSPQNEPSQWRRTAWPECHTDDPSTPRNCPAPWRLLSTFVHPGPIGPLAWRGDGQKSPLSCGKIKACKNAHEWKNSSDVKTQIADSDTTGSAAF